MKFSERRMSDNDHELGLVRAKRNNWGKTIEEKIINGSPLPITYDVTCTQPANFSEYTYTELLGGMILRTQSVEINCRIIDEASSIESTINNNNNIEAIYNDKYETTGMDIKYNKYKDKDICFFVGHNLFDLISREIIAREAFENENFYVKLHPLTNDEYAGKIAKDIGWDRIIPKELSAKKLLLGCNKVYVSSATELCIMGVVLDKDISNVSSFFHESKGTYYSINKILCKNDYSKKEKQQVLNNIINCEFSGVLFPWMNDDEIERRINSFYKKSLELKKKYQPLAYIA